VRWRLLCHRDWAHQQQQAVVLRVQQQGLGAERFLAWRILHRDPRPRAEVIQMLICKVVWLF